MLSVVEVFHYLSIVPEEHQDGLRRGYRLVTNLAIREQTQP